MEETEILKKKFIEHIDALTIFDENKVGNTLQLKQDLNDFLAEVESIGKKVTEKYSLYESQSSEEKKLKHSIRPKEIEN